MNNLSKNLILGTTIGMTALNGVAAYAQPSARCQGTQEAYDAWVTASSLFIKAEPKSTSTKLASLFRGDHVTIIGRGDNGYIKIAFGPRLTEIGYVPGMYLTDKPLTINIDKSTEKLVNVTTNNLNMRNMPMLKSSVLGKVHKGYKLIVDNSKPETIRDGIVWLKCKGFVRPNGQEIRREFFVAKKYVSSQSSTADKQEVSTPVAKPEVSTPETKPVAKPEVSTQASKPQVEANKQEVTSTQNKLAPVVTEEAITIVADGKVVDSEGNTLLTLKKGDKVTLLGEDHGIDKTKIKLNNDYFGIIEKSMIEEGFHLHEEFEHGRPCNLKNLGQSTQLEVHTLTKGVTVVNSDCAFFSESVEVPAGAEVHVALDTFNSSTKNVQISYEFRDSSNNTVRGEGFTNVGQFLNF